MASNSETRQEAIVLLHNKMVLEVSNYIFDESLTRVKGLFKDNPLTPKDLSKIKEIQHLFDHLEHYEKIDYGEYNFFTSQIKKAFPLICTLIQKYADKINNLKDKPDDQEDLIVSMDKSEYKKKVGSTVYLECSVKPTPDNVQWAKGQNIPPTAEKIAIDNRKFFSGCPDAPTLVIRKTNKKDELYYQCTAKRCETKTAGDVAHLQVLDEDEARPHSSSQSGSITTAKLTSTYHPSESHGPVEMHGHKLKTTEPEESSSDTRMIRSRSKSRSIGRDRGHKSRFDKRKRRSSSHSTKTRQKYQWKTTEPEESSSDTRMIRSRSKSGSYSRSTGRDRGHKSRSDKRKRRSSSHSTKTRQKYQWKTTESEESSSDTRMIRLRSKSGSYLRSTGRDRGHKSRSDKRKRRSSSHSPKEMYRYQRKTTESKEARSSQPGSYSQRTGHDSGHRSRSGKRKRRSTSKTHFIQKQKSKTAGANIPSKKFDNKGCNAKFSIKSDIDVTDPVSRDIRKHVAGVTAHPKRLKIDLDKGSIIVCVKINAATNAKEPSALHLAKEIENYFLDGGVMHLSDESNTVLNVDTTSFEITPQNVPENGPPYVSISHGELTASKGKSIFLQSYIITSSPVLATQWFRINDEDSPSPIEIDNKKYFGGSDLSPTLIIRNVNREDQGCYYCLAMNETGIGSSHRTFIRINKAKEKSSESVISVVATDRQEPNVGHGITSRGVMKQNVNDVTTHHVILKAKVSEVSTGLEVMEPDISHVTSGQRVLEPQVGVVADRRGMEQNVIDVTSGQGVPELQIGDVVYRRVMEPNVIDVISGQGVMQPQVGNKTTGRAVAEADISDLSTNQEVTETDVYDDSTGHGVMKINVSYDTSCMGVMETEVCDGSTGPCVLETKVCDYTTGLGDMETKLSDAGTGQGVMETDISDDTSGLEVIKSEVCDVSTGQDVKLNTLKKEVIIRKVEDDSIKARDKHSTEDPAEDSPEITLLSQTSLSSTDSSEDIDGKPMQKKGSVSSTAMSPANPMREEDIASSTAMSPANPMIEEDIASSTAVPPAKSMQKEDSVSSTAMQVAETETTRIVAIIKKQSIDDLKILEKTYTRDEINSFAIPHFVAVYGSTEMIECMTEWKGIDWNAQCEIPGNKFGESLKGIGVSKATALYLATFLDRKDIVRSLIKFAQYDNITQCLKNLHLSIEMEDVFMITLAEKVKYKHCELKPAVIPGHLVEGGGKRSRVFIVYSTRVIKASNYDLDGIGSVMIRNPYMFVKENGCNAEAQIRLSDADSKRAEKALSIHRENLWKRHSNLNIISASAVIHRGRNVIDKPCIVLYCSTKGVVPLGEPDFPKQLDIGEGNSIDVDVHEGYFIRCGYNSLPSVVHHDTLKMGCNIGRLTPEYDAHGNLIQGISGTHGPFVKFNNKIGFLTCAHVLFDIPPTSQSLYFQHTGHPKIEVVQPSSDATTSTGIACGHVDRAVFDIQLNPSVDAAVVELTDYNRIPKNGRFANSSHSSYKDAGFQELPEFNSGSVQTDLKHYCGMHPVVKFGSASDVTIGVLAVYGVDVRLMTTALGLPRGTGRVEMINQLQVSGIHPNTNFFQKGDSGSAVFMTKSGTTELHLIGMAIGSTYTGTNPFPVAVVTPIGDILKALGPDISIASFP